MPITTVDLRPVCELVRSLCGISLDESKNYLIESRLGPIVKQEQLSGFDELVTKARSVSGRALCQKIIDAITTQETLFFRDNSPYDALRFKALPELLDVKATTAFPKRVRVWSAACSTGQEPYSIAMIFHELVPNVANWDIQIFASDISDSAIAKASKGWYSDLEVGRGMPTEMRNKYFNAKDGGWQVDDKLRAMISFRKVNLLEPLPPLGPIDVLFCRNVAIYFDKPQRDDLFRRFKSMMSPEAYMFIGASESLIDLGPEFSPQFHCRSSFYRPNLKT